MANRVSHQEIVKRLLDSKAVDFAAMGKMVGELGPSVAMADEPWECFCGTMRYFFHCYVLPPVVSGELPLVTLPNPPTD
jgi:hypothetical protein